MTNSSRGSSEEKHLVFLLAEDLEVRAGLRRFAARCEQVVDLLLLLRHAAHVVGERGRLALLGVRRLEAQQLGERLAVRPIGGDAFLQAVAVLA